MGCLEAVSLRSSLGLEASSNTTPRPTRQFLGHPIGNPSVIVKPHSLSSLSVHSPLSTLRFASGSASNTLSTRSTVAGTSVRSSSVYSWQFAEYAPRVSSRTVSATAFSSAWGREHPPEGGLWEEMCRAAEALLVEANALGKSAFESAKEVLDATQQGFVEFDATHDLNGKLEEVSRAASGKIEGMTFDASRELARMDARFGVSNRIKSAADEAMRAAEELDIRYQIRQSLRRAQWEAAYHWMAALRHLNSLRRSPLFPFLAGLAFAWLLVTGCLTNLLFWTLWLLPLFPIVARTVVKMALIEGNCPSCGRHFIGPRRDKLSCRQCKEVVWQPKDKQPGREGGMMGFDRKKKLVVIDISPSSA